MPQQDHCASIFRFRKIFFPVDGAVSAAESSLAGRRSTRKVNGDLLPPPRLGPRRQATRRDAGHNAQGASPMFKTAAVLITFVFCAADASTSKAQQLTTQKPRLSDNAWHNHGWGFAGPGVYNEKNPSIRRGSLGSYTWPTFTPSPSSALT